MSLNSIKILGISITIDSKKNILEEVKKYIKQSQKSKVKSQKSKGKPLIIATPNPEQVVYAQKDKHFARLLNQADVTLPDGTGIVLAAQFLNGKWQMANGKWKLQRIPGVEFMEDLTTMAAKQGYNIGLIGGRGGLAVKALECLSRRTPGLAGWAEDGPEIKLDQLDTLDQFVSEIAQKIRTTGAQMVFVGFGAPKQEHFIDALARQLSIIPASPAGRNYQLSIVLMSVGGSFDILAGHIKRAPLLIRLIGLEWFWRLIQEPWRLGRQLALIKFLILVIRAKLLQ
ncbi:WecB/TagA/CpsF family glycosyltransferase [Patescibacteria group bacterium]|nr:WecB/TagA/CpsF family glycosyltransferase [Patescibacteria group bacterium]MBU1472537.1 WecB/TagA/CpsF family glycosyltransferase [Patescibacteria group bacterium]MBU2460090.1 WecB/TagA/CpsF family glycosyltransferase [Patescibacteria group bacterium]MBU2544659.1 WecB/TagA/CpsF family glycosyltransferase [Patescibacteria group bacterium]